MKTAIPRKQLETSPIEIRNAYKIRVLNVKLNQIITMLLLIYLLLWAFTTFRDENGNSNSKYKISNNTIIITNHDQTKCSQTRNPSAVTSNEPRITYSAGELKALKNRSCQPSSSCLAYNAIGNIQKLGINKRKRRRKRCLENLITPGAQLTNLVTAIIEKSDGIQYDNKLKIGLVNARSVKNKDAILHNYMIEKDLDIMVITETWLKDSDTHWLKASSLSSDYITLETVNRNERRGGGVAICHTNNIQLEVIEKQISTSLERITVKVTNTKKPLTITGLYHPPAGSIPENTMTAFVDDLTDFLTKLLQDRRNNIILGDFNIHLEDLSNSETAIFRDTMDALGLQQNVKQATHISGSTLDLCYTESFSDIKLLSCQPDTFISDHSSILVTSCFPKTNLKRLKKSVRNYSKPSDDQWCQAYDTTKVLITDDVNQSAKSFENHLSTIANELAPLKEIKVTVRKPNVWYNATIREQKRVVRSREKIWRKYREKQHWTAYQKERTIYTNLVNYHKTQTISQKVLDCHRDSKKLHNLINVLTSSEVKNPMPDANSNEELTERFADFFLNKIQTIRDNLQDTPKYEPSDHTIPSIKRWAPLTCNEVKKIIMSMQSKSCETDCIPTTVLKQMLPSIIEDLTQLINVLLSSGVFCDHWKEALVRPLLKKVGLDLICKSYRPVSNLPFLGKLLERCMLDQLVTQCDEYSLLPDFQSAYRKGFSCETSLVKLTNDVLWSMENCEITMTAVMDLSAAFDTVDHDILLSVLSKRFGITDRALEWVDSYLRPRNFSVVINNATSKPRDLDFSVPQGSSSGAFLYICYASSIADIVPNSFALNGFADDHSIRKCYRAGNKTVEYQTLSETELVMKNIKDWMSSMRLKMNDEKMEFILFGGSKQLSKSTITHLQVNDICVHRSTSIKYLGAWLDESLTMEKHIVYKCRSAMLSLFKVRSIRKFLTKEACADLVVSLVLSHLDYANALLIDLPKKSIKKLQLVQNMAAKVVLNKRKYDSASQCMQELHWLPIARRIEFKVIILVHDCIYKNTPPYLAEMLRLKVGGHRLLRSSTVNSKYILEVPFCKKKTHAERSFSIQGPRLWNSLPEHLRIINNKETFKRKLKTHMFNIEYC